jgi:hypothetical protein
MDFFHANADRVKYFQQRVEELKRSGADTVIAVLNVDDARGGILADILMPGATGKPLETEEKLQSLVG